MSGTLRELVERPLDAMDTTDRERCELLKSGGREIEVVRVAACATIDYLDYDRFSVVCGDVSWGDCIHAQSHVQ